MHAMPLAELQRHFHGELLCDEPRSSLAAHPGFAIHQQTMLRAAIDALEANFPAVACLVGQAWFRSAAAAYAAEYPARDARLVRYGEHFATFLAASPVAVELPYLADVARLDRLWAESYIAADMPALLASDLHGLDGDALGRQVVAPHPATRTLTSDLPALAIWVASRAGLAVDDDLAWEPQVTLITRAGHDVATTLVDASALTFLEACGHGAALASCVERVSQTHPAARPDHVFGRLLIAGALVAV